MIRSRKQLYLLSNIDWYFPIHSSFDRVIQTAFERFFRSRFPMNSVFLRLPKNITGLSINVYIERVEYTIDMYTSITIYNKSIEYIEKIETVDCDQKSWAQHQRYKKISKFKGIHNWFDLLEVGLPGQKHFRVRWMRFVFSSNLIWLLVYSIHRMELILHLILLCNCLAHASNIWTTNGNHFI